MENNEQKINKIEKIKAPGLHIALVLICIALSVADIALLYLAFGNVTRLEGFTPVLLVMVFTMLADFFAFEWGKSNGEQMTDKLINRGSLKFFILWACMGVMFMAIRIINIFVTAADAMSVDTSLLDEIINVLPGEIVMIVLLLILYIGTGLGLATGFRNIFDYDSLRYRTVKNKFETLHAGCANSLANVQKIVDALQMYDENYKSLDEQKNHLQNMVENSKKSTIDMVMGKVVQKNEYMDAEHVDKITKEILKERLGE